MKRFTETDKWIRDKWFSELDPRDKLFWLFIIDQCDNVGVWEVNFRTANFLIGYGYKPENLLLAFGDKIQVLGDGEKWFIASFIDFQHGVLKEDSGSKPILSYVALLKKHNLWIPYTNTIHSVQGKGKGKGKGKGEGKGEGYTTEFQAWWKIYRKGNKSQAFAEWKNLKDIPTDLHQQTETYMSYCESAERPLLDGERFLKRRTWETEWTHEAQGTDIASSKKEAWREKKYE